MLGPVVTGSTGLGPLPDNSTNEICQRIARAGTKTAALARESPVPRQNLIAVC
jgi:hypothetical protein